MFLNANTRESLCETLGASNGPLHSIKMAALRNPESTVARIIFLQQLMMFPPSFRGRRETATNTDASLPDSYINSAICNVKRSTPRDCSATSCRSTRRKICKEKGARLCTYSRERPVERTSLLHFQPPLHLAPSIASSLRPPAPPGTAWNNVFPAVRDKASTPKFRLKVSLEDGHEGSAGNHSRETGLLLKIFFVSRTFAVFIREGDAVPTVSEISGPDCPREIKGASGRIPAAES